MLEQNLNEYLSNSITQSTIGQILHPEWKEEYQEGTYFILNDNECILLGINYEKKYCKLC